MATINGTDLPKTGYTKDTPKRFQLNAGLCSPI